jgi:predicted secreted protein
MAVFVLTDATVSINTVTLGDYVRAVTVNYERDSIEVTTMGTGGASAQGHKFIGGLQNISVTLELLSDEAATKTNATLFSATGSGTNTLVIKNSSTGDTYTCSNMFLQASQPVTGSIGELSVQSVTFTGGTLVKS